MLSSQKSFNKLNQSKVSQFMYEDIASQRQNEGTSETSEAFFSPFQNSPHQLFSPVSITAHSRLHIESMNRTDNYKLDSPVRQPRQPPPGSGPQP